MRFKEYLREFQTHLEYHDDLNSALWVNAQLIDEVKEALVRIADNFIEFLNIPQESIHDIVLTGSNCNYNYSDLSDIDLHLIADFDPSCTDCIGLTAEDCLNAKKTLWNSQHDVSINGFAVEVYVQHKSEVPTSNAGIFSLRNLEWIQKPAKEIVDLSNGEIMVKAQPLIAAIDNIVDNEVDDAASIQDVKDKIRNMRNAGLKAGGEFSVQNLSYKVLRNMGYLDKLYNYAKHVDDLSLSLMQK